MSGTGLPPNTHLRPRVVRTKTGCLCCRLRRKKCDEEKPQCSACIRNDLICSWSRPSIEESNTGKHSDLGWRLRLKRSFAEAPDGFIRPEVDSGLFLGVGLLKAQRIAMYHPSNISSGDSQILYEHYILETGPMIEAQTVSGDSLMWHILRLAPTDSMVMNAALAMSGAHFCYNTDNAALWVATLTHYGSAMRLIKNGLTARKTGSPRETLNFLLSIILLCQYEAIAGNPAGASYHHLRACREFIIETLHNQPYAVCQENETTALLGILLEFYAYLTLVSNITFSMGEEKKTLISDQFVCSLRHLRQYKTFGIMFGCSSGVYEFIPPICHLAATLRTYTHSDSSHLAQHMTTWVELECKIIAWTPTEFLPGTESWIAEQRISARTYKVSMLMFLHAAKFTNSAYKSTFLTNVQPLIDEALPLLRSLCDSVLATTMMWPIMIVGSCLNIPSQQAELREQLTSSRFKMRIVDRAVQLLDWVWEDTGAEIFGPHALEAQMKRHNFVFCMS